MGIESDSVTTNEASGNDQGKNDTTQNPTQHSNKAYDLFQSLLLDWGFTGSQILFVKDALRKAVLDVIAREPDS